MYTVLYGMHLADRWMKAFTVYNVRMSLSLELKM